MNTTRVHPERVYHPDQSQRIAELEHEVKVLNKINSYALAYTCDAHPACPKSDDCEEDFWCDERKKIIEIWRKRAEQEVK